MSEPRNKRLLCADTVYGLLQSTNDLLRDRFTSNGRTLDSNDWRGCNVYSLEEGFWKAITDRDFGSVLTYAIMLGGRDVNVADLIHNALESYGEQVLRIKGELHTALESETTLKDTIRLQGITNSQHEQTIKDLRAKLEDKGVDPNETAYVVGFGINRGGAIHTSGMATLESTPELCYSVETVAGEVVETTVIQGDPAAVKDLVQVIRAEKAACNGPANVYIDMSLLNDDIAKSVKAAAAKGATDAYANNQKLFSVSPAEAQSRFDRLQYATGLILQLPDTHDGRATWLLNYASHSDPDVQEAIRQHPRAFTSIEDAVKWVNDLKSEAPAV